jgi:Ca-activated chloride channel family protein
MITAFADSSVVSGLSLFCFYIISRIDGARDDASITAVPGCLGSRLRGHGKRRSKLGACKKSVMSKLGQYQKSRDLAVRTLYLMVVLARAISSVRMAGIFPAAARAIPGRGFGMPTGRKGQRLLHLALLALVVSAAPAVAQVVGPGAPNPSHEPDIKNSRGIEMNVEMALVNVTVTDPYSRLVTGLDKENFRVFEDGIEQEIASFSSEDVPISIGLVFDMSGSMSDKVDKARQAAVQFLRTANPRDEFFLVSFNDRAELTSRFTSSIEELQNRMMFTVAKGRTALLDAIYLGLSQMRGARNGKRALLIISDGGDNHSRYNEADIRNFLKEADCQLYAMGVFDVNDMGRTTEERYGPSLLSELAEMTGGRVFPVASLTDLPDIAAKIGMELRNQYVVGYKPSDVRHNGAWRKIKVKLLAPKGLPPLNVYAKTGYYAPAQ